MSARAETSEGLSASPTAESVRAAEAAAEAEAERQVTRRPEATAAQEPRKAAWCSCAPPAGFHAAAGDAAAAPEAAECAGSAPATLQRKGKRPCAVAWRASTTLAAVPLAALPAAETDTSAAASVSVSSRRPWTAAGLGTQGEKNKKAER